MPFSVAMTLPIFVSTILTGSAAKADTAEAVNAPIAINIVLMIFFRFGSAGGMPAVPDLSFQKRAVTKAVPSNPTS